MIMDYMNIPPTYIENQTVDDLAIFGGKPAFEEQIHVGRPNIGDREHLLERINHLLDRRWLTNAGPYVEEFEAKVAALLGVKHCIAMCNATVALEIAIRAAGLSGEVILPSFTFIATAHALQWQAITPIFCDIDPSTHNLDPDQVEKMITPRTTGIIGVHLWGRACDVDTLSEIAQRRHLKLLFDAAHAFGCSYKDRMIGNFGIAEVFSFHATKFFNTFEGGAVTTQDDELAAKIRLMKNFGFGGYDNVVCIGTNGKMSEISAAMGLTSLESINEFIWINKRNYDHYKRELADIPGVSLIKHNDDEKSNYQYIIVETDKKFTVVSRDELQQILIAENVLARRYFYPGCHRMEPYRSNFPHSGLLLPVTERVASQVLALPTGQTIETTTINKICEIIRFVVAHGPEIKQRLATRAEGHGL